MEFRVLGPVEVRDRDRLVALPTAKVRTLLVVLLLRANQVVTIDELVDQTWGEALPANPRATVQTNVQRLRRALGDESAALIRTRPRGYLIELDPRRLDLLWFRQLGEQAHGVEDLGRRHELLSQALDLWRGPPLAGVSTESLLREEVPRLIEERLAAQEQLIDVRLALGEHGRLVPELIALTREHPLRERVWAQLMLALYRSGRQAEALQVYRAVAGQLSDELGVDPTEDLQRLHHAMLIADPSLAAPPPAGRPSSQGWVAECQLPLQVGDFVGRAHLVDRIEELLAQGHGVPIVTVSGSPGVGKTALAIRVAHRLRPRFPDGQWYVRLDGATNPRDPEDVLAELLRSSGLATPDIPARLDARAAVLRARLADRRVLLCLDDAAGVEQVEPLLPGTAGSAVLVTSRYELPGLTARYSARGYNLDVLTPEEATALLAQVLGAERANAEPAAVAELAKLCAYLPLALRITAANLAGRPGTPLARWVTALRTGDPLARLSLPGDRSAAVRTAFDHSYSALAPQPQRLFRLLGLIPGHDFTAEAAAALLDVDTEYAERLLDTLASVNLVQRHAADRYLCHDLLRRYAAELVQVDPDRDGAWHRLCDWYLTGAAAAAPHHDIGPPRLVPATTADTPHTGAARGPGWVDAERGNLVAAILHAARIGPHQFAWQLADALHPYFRQGQHLPEWRAATEAGLQAAESAGDQLAQAAMHYSMAILHERVRGPQPAIRHHQAALERYRSAGHDPGVAAALCGLGLNHFIAGDMSSATAVLDQAITLIRGQGLTEFLGTALNCRGIVQVLSGDLAGALRSNAAAMRTPRPPTVALLINRGGIRRLLGEYEAAAADVTAGLSLAGRLGQRRFQKTGHDELARIWLDAGRLELAGEHATRTLSLARQADDAWCEAGALISLGELHRIQANLDQAGEYYRQALLVATARGLRVHEAEAQLGLAMLHRCAGHPARAREHAQLALDLANSAGLRIVQCQVLNLFAALCHDAGNLADAARYAERARHLQLQTGYRPAAHMSGMWSHSNGPR